MKGFVVLGEAIISDETLQVGLKKLKNIKTTGKDEVGGKGKKIKSVSE